MDELEQQPGKEPARLDQWDMDELKQQPGKEPRR